MFKKFILFILRCILKLRYRVNIIGMEEILKKGKKGMLLLPNHPALMDPIIVLTHIYPYFQQRTLGDKDQVNRPIIKFFARFLGVLPLPDPTKYGNKAIKEVERVINKCGDVLRKGKNILLYPSGHIMTTKYEDLGGNSAVETILNKNSDSRIVLVRTRGLWGSSWSRSSGDYPSVTHNIKQAIKFLIMNGIFFAPKREITIEFFEPEDFPVNSNRLEMNKYIENYYNHNAPSNFYVPYYWFEKGGKRIVEEPKKLSYEGDISLVSENVKEIVLHYLRDLTGIKEIDANMKLSNDLGLDSLTRVEVTLWIEKEFGYNVSDPDSLKTVADILYIASGQTLGNQVKLLEKVGKNWFIPEKNEERVLFEQEENIQECFLKIAKRNMNKVVIADQMAGEKTYRNIITGIYALKKEIMKFEDLNIGIMMPASVTSTILYFALVFSGKTPVMVNWTVGERNMEHSLNNTEVKKVLTSKLLIEKLKNQGNEFGELSKRFVFLEDIAKNITVFNKISALIKSYIYPSGIKTVSSEQKAVVLFTSGSESLPKAVPLSHKNVLTNISDVFKHIHVKKSDALIGFLPPFHSFGITVTILLPVLSNVRVVYHSNPTEGGTLSRLIKHYRATILVGTPTFLSGVVRASSQGDLDTLRFAVTGAEKCPESVYKSIENVCPKALIIEGYGITECSPVVCANTLENPVRQAIGKIMPSLEYVILDVDTSEKVKQGQKGMLYVRGDSIFEGYIGEDIKSPFVDIDGKQYYKTGDLVIEDENNTMFFAGRLKRFIKLGGEMISMPAIEEVLNDKYASEDDEGPVLAVDYTGGEESPEIILATVLNITREEVNKQIKKSGLSALHNVRKIIKVDEIPVLGTGKTNYRELKTKL